MSLLSFFRRRNNDLAREIDAHMAERVDELIEDGLAEADACAQAAREFGNRTLELERSREVWTPYWLTSLWQDLRYAVRSLARQPGFSLTVIGVLAIGIGLVTALFTLVNGVALRPWSVSNPSSLFIVVPTAPPGSVPSGGMSSLEYRYLREHNRSFSGLASIGRVAGGIELVASAEPIASGELTTRAKTLPVTANYFDTLGIDMQAGRSFRDDEEDYGTPQAVAIISDRLWREGLMAAETVVGNVIRIADHPFTVVGVAQQGFRGPDIGTPVDIWIPVTSASLVNTTASDWLEQLADPTALRSSVVGRLRPGVSAEEAAAEIAGLARQFQAAQGLEPRGLSLYDTRMITALAATSNPLLAVAGLLFAALFLVMLLACANAGNLMLARGLSRERELAVRLSIGASRPRVVRQLLVEALLLAAVAGAIALWIATIVPGVNPDLLARQERFSPDLAVFGFASSMAVLACLASGLMPALRATDIDLAARAGNRHAGRSAGAGRLRTTLLAVQIALSTVLLVSAGLLTRTIGHATTLDPGFAIHAVQAIEVRWSGGADAERRAEFTRSLFRAISAHDLPPVALSEFTAITQARRTVALRRDGQRRDMDRTMLARHVSRQYFDVLGIPVVQGRTLADDGPFEVVLNESAAKLFWPEGDAIGQRLVVDDTQAHDVVGVVKDVPVTTLTASQPAVYLPVHSSGLVLVRDLSPVTAERIAALAHGLDPDVRVTSRPLADDLVAGATSVERKAARNIAWTIAGLALCLATIGASGVFAYMVEERRREIGVRMALGARTPQIAWNVVSTALRPLLYGLGGGLLLSLVLTPLLRSFLYGLSPFDPITYAGIAVILVTAALVATWIPARRATRIDPAVTLRGD